MITWVEGKYTSEYAEINGIRIGSIHWSVIPEEGKPYRASFDLPGYRVVGGKHFTRGDAKACIEGVWAKWLARVTQSNDKPKESV